MALSILQTPATCSLAQSPMPFSVSSSLGISETNFQYVGQLWYWTGSVSISSSLPQYTLTKYPNTSGVGIFDVSRIINSTLSNYAIVNPSNVEFYKMKFSTQWLTGSTYVTGSETASSAVYKALDGYAVFQEPIGQPIYNKSVHWPLMTDGPVTQSWLDGNKGSGSIYVGNYGNLTTPTKIFYSSSLTTASYAVSGDDRTTAGQIAHFPMFPSEADFPTQILSANTNALQYSVQAYSGSVALGTPITFGYECQHKYPNVRVMWKNRFGQFDFLNCYGVNTTTFQTDRSNYQPQIGSYESRTLSYNGYDTQLKTYIVNAKQALTVNTQYLSQDYNDIFKQFLSSDEMYWVYDEVQRLVRPITINVNSLTFKTGVNDKLIQYTFTFDYGQGYKLII
jgi:hypothetical protein